MNRLTKLGLTAALTALLGACATTPPGPPPEVVRLQAELDRLHNDPRIAPNAPNELRDADALVVSSARVTRGVMSALEGLKVVVRTGVGYDVIDVPAATELGDGSTTQ